MSKFKTKRDGQYIILNLKFTNTFVITSMDNPNELLGTCHISVLKLYNESDIYESCVFPTRIKLPVAPIRKHSRPPKKVIGSTAGRSQNQRRRL